MTLETARISDFSGGLNSEDASIDLLPNESPWFGGTYFGGHPTANLELLGRGNGFRTRRGITKLVLSTPLPVPGTTAANLFKIITSLSTFRASGAVVDKLICSNEEGGMWTIDITVNPATVVNHILPTGGTSGRLYSFAQMADVANAQTVYMSNGNAATAPQKLPVGGALAAWPGAPPNGSILCTWKTYMLVSGVTGQRQRLYFSKPGDPETWPAANNIDIKSVDDEDDAIVGLQVIGENLLVFKQNSVWLVFDPVTFDNRRIASVGLVNKFAIAPYLDRVFWTGVDGIWSTDGEDIRLETKNMKRVFQGWDPANVSNTVRMGALPDGMMVATTGIVSTGINHILTTDFFHCDLTRTRDDAQHPWFTHSGPNGFETHALATVVRADGNRRFVGIDTDILGTEQSLWVYFNTTGSDDLDGNGVGDSSQFGAWLTRPLAFSGLDNYCRIRRVDLVGKGPSVSVDINGSTSFNDAAVANKATYRFRPNVRDKTFEFRLSCGPTSEVHEVEVKFRGGVEH